MAQMVKNLPAMWETWVQSLGWEDLLETGMAVFLPGEFHGQRSLAIWQVCGVTESDTTEQLSLTIVLITNKKQTKKTLLKIKECIQKNS